MSIPESATVDPYVLFDVPYPSPIVLSSTHSGRSYPPSLLRRSSWGMDAMRLGEDPYVDVLIEAAGAHGIPRICATFARAYVDLNRDPRELDPTLFDPAPLAPELRASDRVQAGLGVIPRSLAPGQNLYNVKLPLAEAELRLGEAHAPFHIALERLLARARARHGYALLLDVHSMPSQPGPNAPQVVVGDLRGRAAADGVVAAVERSLHSTGFGSARNIPYAGAYTLERHGVPMHGMHAVQLEFDRALYLDDARRAPSPSCARIAERIGDFAGALLTRLEQLDFAHSWRIAAE